LKPVSADNVNPLAVVQIECISACFHIDDRQGAGYACPVSFIQAEKTLSVGWLAIGRHSSDDGTNGQRKSSIFNMSYSNRPF
jgi:hypothetical protein